MKRLTPATLTLVMFGIVGLLVVGYVAKTILANSEKKPAPPSLRDMPMAVADIAPGTVITSDHLGMGRFPRSQLTSDMLLVNRVIVGRVAKTPIKAAEPIKANMLYQPGELPPLDIGEGMRAVSIQVGDGVAMVDGMIKPGQYVDVLFNYTGGGYTDQTFQGGMTMRLFEGVKIIAINRNFTQSRVDRGDNHVTLELTQAQANVLVLARDRGTLTLTFNPANEVGDGGVAATNEERVTLYEILGMQRPEEPKEPTKTEIYRGRGMQSNLFDEKGRLVSGSGSFGYGMGNPGVPGSWGNGPSVYGGPGGYNYNPDGTDGNRGQWVLPNSGGNGGAQGPFGPQNAPRSSGPSASNVVPKTQSRVPTASLPWTLPH